MSAVMVQAYKMHSILLAKFDFGLNKWLLNHDHSKQKAQVQKFLLDWQSYI